MSGYGQLQAMDPHGVHRADPGAIRARARQLVEVAEVIDTVSGLLRQVSTLGVWQSPAGETFATHVEDVPVTLCRVAAQLRTSAEVLSRYAPRLADRQDELAEVARQHAHVVDEAAHCDRRLAVMTPEDPEQVVERERRADLMSRLITLEDRYLAMCDEAVAAEHVVAAELVEVGDQLTDPAGYDLFEGVRDLGRSSVVDNPVSWVVKPLALGRALDPLGQAGLKAFYGQGSWRDIGTSSATVGLDSAVKGSGWVVRRTSGLEHAATGAKGAERAGVVTGARTTGQVTARGQAWRGTGLDRAGSAARWSAGKAVEAGRAKAGMQLADDLIADWTMVAGSSRVVKVAQGVNTAAKVGKHSNGQLRTARAAEQHLGQDSRQRTREEDRAPAAAPAGR